MTKVSIIIPCYNQGQYLSEALKSVLEQTYTNWECVVVNDGSPDNTGEIASEWIRRDSRFKYIHKNNGGIADARNVGIAHSTGVYILPLDADDKIAKEYLFEAVNVLDSNPKIKIVYGEAEFFGNKTGKWKLSKYQPDKILIRNMIYCSAFFRRADYDKTSGYNTNMIYGLEDWDFWLSILSEGSHLSGAEKVFRIPKKLFYYRINKVSRSKSIDAVKNEYLYHQIYINHLNLYAEVFPDSAALYQKSTENSSKFKRFVKKYLRK